MSFSTRATVQSERKTWTVIWLCGAMMCAEIAGGLLVWIDRPRADGLHMSTHAGALALGGAGLYVRARARGNTNFTFRHRHNWRSRRVHQRHRARHDCGLIGYESMTRILAPVQIHFAEAIPIACMGLGRQRS